MQRFLVSEDLGGVVLSDHPIYHQMTRVMRARVGDECILFLGDEIDQVVRIESIDKHQFRYSVVSQIDASAYTPQQRVVIFQSLPNKSEKLEYLIQK